MISYGVASDVFKRMNESGKDKDKLAKIYGENGTLGNYVDVMMLLERGVSPELLKGQFEAVQEMEPGNSAAQIERFMKMYNLNYTGGRAVYEMAQNTEGWTEKDWEKHAKEIEEMQTKPGYMSDSQKLQDVLNRIDTQLVNLGKEKIDNMKMPTLEGIAADIYKLLEGVYGKPGEKEKTLEERLDEIPEPAKTGKIVDPEGNEYPANYWGAHCGPVNSGEGDFNAQISKLWADVTGDRNYSNEPCVATDYRMYAETYKRLKNDDGIISSSDVVELIPLARKVLTLLGKESLWEEKSDKEIQFIITGGM